VTVLRIADFTGEIPRLPAHLLPDNAATEAVNCDFAHGELRSLKGLGPVRATAQAVRSVYSDDGLRFFAFASPTRAWRGPTIKDIYGRVYFENPANGLRVTTADQMQNTNYGAPAEHWRVGMPAPTAEDTTVAVVDANLEATPYLQWEKNGEILGDVPILTRTTITPGREYVLTCDPSGYDSVGVFDDLGMARIESVEFIEQLVLASAEGEGSNYDSYTAVKKFGARIGRVAYWKPFANMPGQGANYRVDTAYRGINAFMVSEIPDLSDKDPVGWFIPDSVPANSSARPVEAGRRLCEHMGDLDITARLIGPDTLELAYDFVTGYATGYADSTITARVTQIVANVTRVKVGGAWIDLTEAAGAKQIGATLQARVQGSIDGASYLAYSVGSVGKGDNPDVVVTLKEESPGNVRVKIGYGGTDSTLLRASAYVVTYVNDWNEESAPSPAVLTERDAGQKIAVTSAYKGFADGRPATGMNVYRTYATSDAYILVNPEPIPPGPDGAFSFTDVGLEPKTVSALASLDWEPPLEDLHSLTYVGNGFFAAAVDNDLYFSEPYHPHAWPYAMTFSHRIIGLEAVEGGLLATTMEKPCIVYGAHPQQMTQQLINADQAGVTQRSLTRVAGNAAYVSHDGIVEVAGGQAHLESSQTLFTRQDWRGRYLARFRNLALGAHDGALVGVIDPAYPAPVANTQGFVIRLDEASGTYTRLAIPGAMGLSLVPEVDALYVGLALGFAEFGAGGDLAFSWRSKDFTFPQPVTFGAAVADCSPGLTVSIYCNHALVMTKTIGDGETSFRLPAVPAQKVWAVSFSGTGRIRKFEMGSSFAELKGA
jgi:hypothetical protein